MKVKVKRHPDYPDAVMPIKAHPSDAGADLTVAKVEYEAGYDVFTFHSGLCFEIPEEHVGLLFARSSIYKSGLDLTNCVGVIDAHYRGEVMAKMRYAHYRSTNTEPYDVGDRFAQLVIMPIPEVEYELAEELSETDRGTGGYGSSGR